MNISDSRACFQVLSSPGCVEFMPVSDFKTAGSGRGCHLQRMVQEQVEQTRK